VPDPDPDAPDGAAAPEARHGSQPVPGTIVTVAWRRRGDVTELELVTAEPDDGDRDLTAAVAATAGAISRLPAVAGSRLTLAAEHPAEGWSALPESVAATMGLARRRLLLQLRRPLPVPAYHPARAAATALAVRPFADGADDEAWLRVNNRAFAAHPDQGAETPATLAERRHEPWYDPAGFLVADDTARPGELAGFCWTKVHEPVDEDPALGEIYVIGVDPSHHGEGLGPALVLAGLDHLASRGLGVANLYVEADNEPALRLYRRLGFTVHERRAVYAP